MTYEEHISSTPLKSNAYLTLIIENPNCLAFCCELLSRYEELLQRFTPSDTRVFYGNEIDAFIALSNLERSIDSSGFERVSG